MIQLPQITDEQITALEPALNLQFDEARRNVLKDNLSFDLQACPGSGKTTLLAAKLILLSQQWPWKYRGVCVLSHTNVARDEIIKKLQRHPSGHKFLSYPHFIGTIQEFVNKFLGLPYVRNQPEWSTGYIDNELFDRKAKGKLSQNTLYYLNQKPSVSLIDLTYVYEDRSLKDYIIKKLGLTDPQKDTYKELVGIRKQLSAEGYFLYSDMYAFAEALVAQSPDIIKTLQHRFPFVMLDEMQDANKQQDELLQKIFPLDSQEMIVKRLGDPDQAIFEFGEANESYNRPNNNFKHTIHTSHRFGSDIAGKIKGLSNNKVALEAVSSSSSPKEHTIILYDDNTQTSVLDTFIDIIASAFQVNASLCAKAVGAVAKQNSNGQGVRTNVAIPDYWADYSKPISRTKYTPKSLCEAISLIHTKTSEADLAPKYNLLMEALLELLYLTNNKANDGKRYTKTKLYAYLEESNNLPAFQHALWEWLFKRPDSEVEWKGAVSSLLRLPPFSTISDTHEFLVFHQHADANAESDKQLDANIYRNEKNIPIEVNTVHAVKGETHDATLVLETKNNRVFDIEKLLEHLVDENKAVPTGEDLKRMRTLYVACSRSESLLCLAMHKDNFDQNRKSALEQKGWKIMNLAPPVELREAS